MVPAAHAQPVVAPFRMAAAIADLLTEAGAGEGDLVFLQLDLERVTGLQAGPSAENVRAGEAVLAGIREAIGAGGTIMVPTYTFSFCRHEAFDPAATPTPGGPWSPSAWFLEWFRQRPGVVRSLDPIHSVAADGPGAVALLANLPATCFGTDSLFARLVEQDAHVLMLGLGLDEATVRHHAEESASVPFRFRKLFTGVVREHGQARRTGWVYNVRMLADAAFPDGSRLARVLEEGGRARRAPVGRDQAVTARAREIHASTLELLAADRWATARGPAGDPEQLESDRVGGTVPVPVLSPGASMEEMIEALWHLPRDIVSDGYDAALEALASQLPMTIHRIPSGTACWDWIVPEKWTCHEAFIETVDGHRVLTYADNPLHVVSYSLPFEGEVSREELLRHLHVHPRLDDAIPFVFKYYDREWGLCCSRKQRDQLQDERYRVCIRTSFSFGSLKIGEVVVPGESDESVVLCAHLCHPAMVNDDLTGVVVGMDVMRSLLAAPRGRRTVRFLILPETIGSLAYLSTHPAERASMVAGMFLEMLGRDAPHALQHSFEGRSALDQCASDVLLSRDAGAWTTPFRTLAGNDERQFNAPGVRIPMLSLTRQLPPGDPNFPYREYHSSADTPALVPSRRLEESRDVVLAILNAFDAVTLPALRVPGEVCCSRHGLFIDPQLDPEGSRALFDVLFQLDGTRTMAQIAHACHITEATATRIVARLAERGLLRGTVSRSVTGGTSQ